MSISLSQPTRWSTGAVLAFAAAFFLTGAVAGYGVFVTRADGRAVEANQRAAVEAERAVAAQALADSALEAHRLAVRKLDALEEKRAAPASRLASARTQPVPAVCDTIVQTILAAADTVIAVDSARIAVLEADNERLTSALTSAKASLASAEAELRLQSKRTETAPRKLLGLVPMPKVSLGYGAVHTDGRVEHGPALTVGWTVAL